MICRPPVMSIARGYGAAVEANNKGNFHTGDGFPPRHSMAGYSVDWAKQMKRRRAVVEYQ